MGHATIEWVYVGVVIAILCYVGADAWNIERLLEHAPEDAQVIKVTGQQWLWTFEHEDGTKEVSELHLVKGQPYRFEVTSLDLLVVFIALVMPNLPGVVSLPEDLPAGIAKAVILLYVVEMLLAADINRPLPRAVLALMLAAIALRSLFAWGA